MYISGYRLQTTVVVVAAIGTVAAGVLAAVWISRGRPKWRSLGQAALLWVVVAIAGVSLEPDSGRDGAGTCSFALDLDPAFVLNQRTLNLALYVPLGLLSVLVARTTRQRIAAIAAAAALPVVFELLQATRLVGRSCDIVDVVDNWVGIGVGALIGALVAIILKRPTRVG